MLSTGCRLAPRPARLLVGGIAGGGAHYADEEALTLEKEIRDCAAPLGFAAAWQPLFWSGALLHPLYSFKLLPRR